MHTLVPQVHLHLQGLEVVGERGAGLCAHLLVGPLLQAIEFLVDVHGGGGCSSEARAGGGVMITASRGVGLGGRIYRYGRCICRRVKRAGTGGSMPGDAARAPTQQQQVCEPVLWQEGELGGVLIKGCGCTSAVAVEKGDAITLVKSSCE
jgi:hypothetical protein